MRRVRTFGPGHRAGHTSSGAIQVHHRRVVDRGDGDGAGQGRGRIQRNASRAAGQVVVVAVVNLDAVGAGRIGLVDRRVVGGAVVIQPVQKRRHVGSVGTRVQVDYKRFADAGAGARDGADGGPGRSVQGVVDVVINAPHSAGASASLDAQHITRHVGIGKAYRHATATKIGADSIEVSIGYGGARAG